MDSQLDNHKRILGILYVVWAAITTVAMLGLMAILSFAFQIAVNEADYEEQKMIEMFGGVIQYLPLVVIAFISVPTIIAGVGLLTKKSWAMLFALIVGCLKLLSFPFGTALGAYAIWIYSEEQKMKKASLYS